MIEIVTQAITETAKETAISETKEIPKFFYEMKETVSETDTPINKEDSEHSYIITRNESLEGDVHPITGVPFERETIELPSGETVDGVFPKFESAFEAEIPEELFNETDYKQFKECNQQLSDAIVDNSDLKSKFSSLQLEQIRDGISDGTAPDGYVWHHDAHLGKIQLVDFETHANTGHTGGRTVWGGGNENR